jgi:hypothetical protein
MGGKRLDDKQIEQIKALLATGAAKNEIAKKCGVSWETVDRIEKANPDEIQSYREQKKAEFVNEAWQDIKAAMTLGRQKIRLATVTIDSFQGTIDKLIDLLQDNARGQEDPLNSRDIIELIKAISSVTSIPLSHISTYFGTLYDKQALASGEATGRQELTGKDGGPIETHNTFDLSGLSDEELEQLEKINTKIANAGTDTD